MGGEGERGWRGWRGHATGAAAGVLLCQCPHTLLGGWLARKLSLFILIVTSSFWKEEWKKERLAAE